MGWDGKCWELAPRLYVGSWDGLKININFQQVKFINDMLHDSEYGQIISFGEFQANYDEIMQTSDDMFNANEDFRKYIKI